MTIRKPISKLSTYRLRGVRNNPSVLTKVKEVCAQNKAIIFFAEDRADWIHIGPIADRLERFGHPVLRLTTDPNDTAITQHNGLFVGGTLSATQLFLRLPPCVVVMTMTDLGTFHLKRSIHDVHYVYIFHSLLSTHRAYRANAFDAYDSILCSSPYHFSELTKVATTRPDRVQTLYETGYCRLDSLMSETEPVCEPAHDYPRVLIAPTWGPSSLLNFNIESIIQNLLDESIEVILRFHPMSLRHNSALSDQFSERFGQHLLFSLDRRFESTEAYLKSDIVLSDWSGAAHEFSLGLLRPAIFIDTPIKANNNIFQRLDLVCYEDVVRDALGSLVGLDQTGEVPSIVMSLLDSSHDWKETLGTLRDDTIFNPGCAVEVAARQISELVS